MERIGGVLGLLAGVLLLGAMLGSAATPAGDAPDQEWVDYSEDNGLRVVVQAVLFILGGCALIGAFAFGVQGRVSGPDPIDRAFGQFGQSCATLGAVGIVTAGIVGAASGAAHLMGDVPVDAGFARTTDNLFYGFLLLGAAVPLGVMTATVAVQARRRRTFAAWFMWLSVLATLGMAGGLLFVPFLLLPFWLIGLGVELLRSAGRSVVDASAHPATA
ncbi:MAG: hypothetical protein ACKVVT_06450 [Dehalococcoidia bacterium]